jgi:DNA mismatch repair protein MutS
MSEKILKADKDKTYTPMIQHFLDVKKNHPDALLLYRMGDFYESFFEDAELMSKILNISLTGRQSDSGRIAMAGVPHHSLDNHIPKLIKAGIKIAICDQTEQAVPGKMVRREVTRVITPGTLLENNFLTEKQNNYLASVSKKGNNYGLALADISTGELKVTQIYGEKAKNILFSELSRLPVSECLLPSNNPDFKTDIKTTEWADVIPDNLTVSWVSELTFNQKNAEKKTIKQF